jgi:hypothetical protein
LREAIVLLGITTAVRILMVPTGRLSRATRILVAILSVSVATIHRPDNILIYAIAAGAGTVAYAIQTGYLSRQAVTAVVAAVPFGAVLGYPLIKRGIEFLARTRALRANGRAVYLADVIPHTVTGLYAFSWVGAAYFLYAPFPWMIRTVPGLVVSIEGMISLGFTVTAIWGIRSLLRRNAPAVVALLCGFVIAVVLYGVGTVNYGTGMRHRQMFLWVIFLFGGIGLMKFVKFSANSEPSGTVAESPST